MVERLKKAKSHKDIRYQNQPNGTERKEIAALKAERDELLGYNVYAVGECNKLRAALEEIANAPLPKWACDIALRALEEK